VCARAARELRHHIKAYGGVSVGMTVCPPGTIDRSIGKAKRVLDTRVALPA
jgi:phenylacetate-CoA ligase